MQKPNFQKINPKPPIQQIPMQQQGHVTVRREMQVGPIPDPDTLARYEQILPGIADRIMRQAEKEQDARHSRDNSVIANQHNQHKRDTDTFRTGQYLAAFAVILVVALCAYLVNKGYPTQAASLGGVAIAGVATVFISGRSANKEKETSNSKEESPS